jgi:hypothetical protein
MEKPAAIDAELTKEFVVAGHGDLSAVEEMLNKERGLLNAAWDWGGGDWETALGGASHIGRPDIANRLLEEGARMDLFCAAMLGFEDLVMRAVEVQPNIVRVRGPHGITLVQHALAGGQSTLAKNLVDLGAPIE